MQRHCNLQSLLLNASGQTRGHAEPCRALAQGEDRARASILHAGAAEALVDLAACSECSASMIAAALTLLSLAQGEASQHALIVAGGIRWAAILSSTDKQMHDIKVNLQNIWQGKQLQGSHLPAAHEPIQTVFHVSNALPACPI